jgi:transcriptional regulator with XRE-family HTH domain
MANRSPEPLGDFIRRIRNERNLSLEDVAEQSARFGPRITASYINRIENEPDRRPTADRLTALAHGLGIPVEELFARVSRQVASAGDESDELHLLTTFRELTPERKADLLKMADVWHAEQSPKRSRRRSA